VEAVTEPLPPVLELGAVRKRFGRTRPWVLDGIDLTVAQGEAVQVVGTNGSGKSTLLRIAAGLSRPGSGSVRRRGTASFVPERPPSPAPMTVRAYLVHQARLQGLRGFAIVDALDAAVDEHRLEAVIDRRLSELSKGWNQRCVLAQAFLADPAVVFLDEPWSGVDRTSHDHLIAVLDRVRAAGRALVMTSHEANPMAGLRRLTIAGGRLIDDRAGNQVDEQAAPASAFRRVWLVSRNGDAGLPGRLHDHPGLVDGSPSVDGVVVTITDDAAGDDLLVRVLDAGWTPVRIGEVER
jgi:ABC-2 type transport system ATP-binding protein